MKQTPSRHLKYENNEEFAYRQHTIAPHNTEYTQIGLLVDKIEPWGIIDDIWSGIYDSTPELQNPIQQEARK